jgi:hypothetical protein
MTLAIFLSHSDPTRLIAWCVIGICAGVYLFFNGFRLLRRRKQILNTPVSRIRSASMGMVELSGLAAGPYTIVAPITARSCYFYRTIIWEWKRRGRSNQWVKIAGECAHVSYFLDDNTGKVLIDPRGAELDLHCDFKQEFCDSFFTSKEEAPPNVRNFLMQHGVSTGNKIKVEEYCIKPKNALFVMGTLAENHSLALTPRPIQDNEQDTRTSGDELWFNPIRTNFSTTNSMFATGSNTRTEELSVSEGLLSRSSNNHGLHDSEFARSALGKSILEEEVSHSLKVATIRISSDQISSQQGSPATVEMSQQQKIAAALMKAGIANPAAWTAARISAATAIDDATASASLDGFPQHPAVVLMQGKNDPTFLISWRSQREIARWLGWKCTLMIWSGPALALLCLYLLLNFTHPS